MFGFWSIQGSFLFAMDQGWKRLPLLVVFLFLSSAYGFKGGAYSNAHQRWGQPSDNTFSPHAVQSSVSEVPVTGTLPEEVGSSLFTNRPLKRFNLLQFVKGHDSSHHESMSYAQTAPSSSVFASLPLPLSEKQAGSLTLLQGSGTTITDTASVSTQSTSGQSTSDQSFPSLYMSSSQETSGVESAEAALPVFSQESISYSSSSAPGATYTSQGSPVPLSEGSSQAISPQDESSYSRLFQSQGASSHYTPDSYTKLSSSSVSSQSTSDQSPPSLYSSSSQDSSGSLLEASGSFFQGEMVGLSSSDLSPESQTSGQLLPSSLEVSSQFTNGQGSPSLFIGSSKSSSDSQSTGPASLLDTQGSLSQSILSTQTQGSTSQGSAGPELSGSSGQFIPTQVEGGSYSVSQLFNSSPYAPGSLMYGKFGPLPIRVSSQSTSTQSSPGTPLTSSRFPVQGGSSSTSSLYLKPQGTLGLYAPASSTKYVSVPMPQRAVYSQATSGSGALFGTSIGLASQGMSSTYSGSVQPQGTTSQFAPGSPSFSSSQKQFTSSYGTQSRSSLPLTLQGSATYGGSLQAQGTASQFAPGSPSYPSVSLSSPQGAASQSATVLSSRKQFTSSYGTQTGSSLPLTLQGGAAYGGSLQPQGTASQFAPGSPSSYPSVPLSSPQGAASQSATVLSSRKQFTSSYGTQSGSSLPLALQGSPTYGGSLQPQGTASQFVPGSPSSGVSLSSAQGAASQPATVPSSRKQFTSSYGTQTGSSLPLTLQGGAAYGGSLQPQGTTSQFAPGSPSSFQSVSLSSPQGAASQSAAVLSSRKQFTSSYGTQSGSSLPLALQGSPTYGGSLQPQGTASQFAPGSPSSYPSVSLSSPQGAASQSATVLSSRKQFTSSYGTQTGSSLPLALQGSPTYGGSLQPQGTASQLAPGSPSSYPSVSLSSPQGAASQSATVLSSRKQFTSSYGTQTGSSLPLTLQGGAAYGGSLQPQGTASQFAPGSPSPSVSLSSPQGAASQSATVLSSRKQFTSSYGTQTGSSLPLTLQGGAAYGGSLQPQGTTGQFAPGSPSPSVSLSSPQGAASQSATVLSSRKQFTSSYGTQSGSSLPLALQGSPTYGGSLQPQGTTSQFAPGSPSSFQSVSLSSPQGVASQPSQAFQSYSVSQSQKSQRWQPSQGIQTSGAAVSQGIDLSQSSPMQSRFSSLSSAGGPSSKDSGLYVSAQGGGTSYGGFSLNSQSPLKYNPGSHAYAKFGSSPLAVSSQSTSDQHSNGLYSSGSLQTQGLLGVVEGPSSQAPFDSPSSNQIERFVMLQRPTGSNLAPSLGLSAQASSVSMLSGVPQTAQALRESGSDVQLNNQVSSNSQANAYTSLQKFSSNYGAQSLKPSELLRYEPGVYGQGTSSASELLSSYGSTYNLNAPASIPSRSSLSSRYYSVKG
ncbi:uncharacterized protein LOC127520375 isoform X6 [Ctenopharyngodon idella]|uniref:uncharacterized protein LOC127520375 isoform X5 n=1 Tax=Ctenopharyngodon idella TaxID=7959 RepID=UPI00222F9A88|nr:uncharacterized protein LOC127520375 isoform X5 [Ctenopharyngodon idella]XP_051764329.1 uncharacterized protein LOC127520375 isoform X6 [Ctenopharyngodon idella]